jgi:hypothetical protein
VRVIPRGKLDVILEECKLPSGDRREVPVFFDCNFSIRKGYAVVSLLVLVGLSIMLIAIGIKGFTPSGLQFSKDTVLTGRDAKIVGGTCIAIGVGLIPLFKLFFSKFL